MNTEFINIKTILLAEDDLQDVELTMVALEEQHLADRVVVVRDGAKALDYLYRRGEFEARAIGNPILALLDLKMPKLNGLDVLKVIKVDENLRLIPVVMLSSSREPSDLAECYHHGANAYAVKPMYFAEFVKLVKEICVFWTTINEPPPQTRRAGTSISDGKILPPKMKEGAN